MLGGFLLYLVFIIIKYGPVVVGKIVKHIIKYVSLDEAQKKEKRNIALGIFLSMLGELAGPTSYNNSTSDISDFNTYYYNGEGKPMTSWTDDGQMGGGTFKPGR